MCFYECNNELSSMLNTKSVNESFVEYVYKKISRDTRNRSVERNEDCVDIILSDHPSIKVVPVFKNMDKDNLSIDDEIKQACDFIENSDFQYIYFVYPKCKSFNRHIQVKVPQLEEACSEYMIKLIPYSLNSNNKINKIKRRRSC